jgi:hypothetical protein
MTAEEKIRYGLMALGGASLILATLGVHIGPIEARNIINGAGDL